ncbi:MULTISPECIES: queuosine precursor transporter [unclassified Treponema]|uniref:queuosine precursor transporter n=1 Tax=unclassified Treponema TaxID=2638727 RepID=UPI0020A4D871|nr:MULTISPECIES: queuosine precursor transporter [unclassified Treponema]UTC67359.1 queuosine precursor transporter [Treponema sp. OMZ 789]UTC70087.1 queuosine precursor transporter [Treponema sp. OMZ 790]UTC72803.1 queuosine precursor transporter [Treponema sp. OMZ 791]
MENTQLNRGVNESDPIKKTNFLPVISGLFVGILVLSNILAAKMVEIGPFVFDGGTLLFPFSYIFGDVLAEVYGYKASRKVIWTGFFMLLIMSLNIWLVSVLPAEAEWVFQKDFDNILLQMPRISAGSLCGYFVGEYSNSVVLSKLKVITKGKHLWLRTIGSTLVGQLLDSIVFVVIAFLGLYSLNVLIVMIFSNYLFKTFIEVIFTPLTYKVISFVKKHEQIDVYDYDVSYNPLPGK